MAARKARAETRTPPWRRFNPTESLSVAGAVLAISCIAAMPASADTVFVSQPADLHVMDKASAANWQPLRSARHCRCWILMRPTPVPRCGAGQAMGRGGSCLPFRAGGSSQQSCLKPMPRPALPGYSWRWRGARAPTRKTRGRISGPPPGSCYRQAAPRCIKAAFPSNRRLTDGPAWRRSGGPRTGLRKTPQARIMTFLQYHSSDVSTPDRFTAE